jgi:hypothetical protein
MGGGLKVANCPGRQVKGGAQKCKEFPVRAPPPPNQEFVKCENFGNVLKNEGN